MYIHLAEVDYLDPLTMGVSTLRFCSGEGGFCTRPSDTPANTFYEPRLKIPNNYQVSIFSDGVKGGSAQGGFGTAQFLNADGYFDQFSEKCFDGQKFRLLYGESNGAYSSFAVLLTGTMTRPEYTWKYFNVKTRDNTQLFNRAASQTVYLGNNVAGVGIEGTPGALMGQTKPLCFGKCFNITPAKVSDQHSLYQVHNGSIQGVDAVYSNGITLSLDTTQGAGGYCSTLAQIMAASPTAGKYCLCLPLGLIRVTGNASSTLTADVRGDSSGPDGYTDTIPGIVKLLAANYCRRARTNWCLQSENPGDPSWVKTGLTIGAAAPTTPMYGLSSKLVTSVADSTLKKMHPIDTSMLMYGHFVKADTSTQFQLKIENEFNSANNVLARFDLSTGLVTQVQSNGAAVGPQYTATGFITVADIVVYPDGWYFLWVAGQPDQSFSSVTTTLTNLNGTSFAIASAQIEKYSSPSMYPGVTTTTPVTSYDPPTAPEINAASFAALSGLTQSVGYYVTPGGTDTVGSIIETLCDSLSCYTAHNRMGELIIGRMIKPLVSDVPKAVFTSSEILRDEIESVIPYSSSDGTPAYRVVLQAAKNWTTQDENSVATSLWDTDPMRVAWLKKDFREIRAEDATTLAKHPLACEITKNTLLNKQDDALAECRRLLQLYRGELLRFSFTVKLEFVTCLNIGDTISMVIDRFGLDVGKNFVLIGITETHENGRVRLEVLG